MQVNEEVYGGASGTTGELVTGGAVLQSFTAIGDKLKTLSVNFATFKKKWIAANIIVEILDIDNKRVFIKNASGNAFVDNAFTKFQCNSSLRLGDKYFIKITTSNGVIGSSVTCKWGTRTHSSEVMFVNGNIKNGELYCAFTYEKIESQKKDELKSLNDDKTFSPGLISVVIPCFNSSSFIADTLNSLKSQLYNHFEIIVVDDGSSDRDRLDEVLEQHGLKVSVSMGTNKGASAARNAGIKLAKGEFVFFCDSDVKLNQTIFAKMVQTMHDHPEDSWVYCNFKVGNKRHKFFEFDPSILKKKNFCSTMSLVKARDLVEFDENLKRLQDWDMFLTMNERGKTGRWIDEYLFTALDREDGITKNSISWQEASNAVKKKHGGK